jgi:SET domain-containing protein
MELPFKVAKSERLGDIRCLKAERDIRKGEVIEECPVIPVKKAQVQFLAKTVMDNYYFEWKDEAAIALGYGSLMNHSYNPNVEFDHDFKNGSIIFSALRDIKKGEELFINYNQGVSEPVENSYLSYDKEITSII